MILEIILLILLSITCIYASITDIKYSIIANKYLILFAVIGIVVDIIYYSYNLNLIPVFLFNLVIVFISSIALYSSHIWAAGDSKLLIVVSLLIPAQCAMYDAGYLFEILIPIYAFALSFGYLIIDTIYLQIKNKYRLPLSDIKKQFKIYVKRLIINSIYIVTIVKLENVILLRYEIELGVFQLFINIFILLLISNVGILQRRATIIGTLIFSIMLSAVTGNWMMNLNRLEYYGIVALFILIRIIVSEYNYMEISIEDLKPGMILSSYTTMLFSNSKVKGLPKLSTEDLRSRLDINEVNAIKRWHKSKYGLDKVTIVKKVPFAIFITLGVLMYMILGVYLRCTLV